MPGYLEFHSAGIVPGQCRSTDRQSRLFGARLCVVETNDALQSTGRQSAAVKREFQILDSVRSGHEFKFLPPQTAGDLQSGQQPQVRTIIFQELAEGLGASVASFTQHSPRHAGLPRILSGVLTVARWIVVHGLASRGASPIQARPIKIAVIYSRDAPRKLDFFSIREKDLNNRHKSLRLIAFW